MRRFLMTLAVIAAPGLAGAATLQVDASGQLTGATGVDVGGTLYDVRFEDGTCAALFDGCDSLSDFPFTTLSEADHALAAISSQVLVDTPEGAFDTMPALTRGCGDSCLFFISYQFSGSRILLRSIRNFFGSVGNPNTGSNSRTLRNNDFSNSELNIYVVFTPSDTTPIPLPAAGWMLLAGLGGLGLLRRRTARRA